MAVGQSKRKVNAAKTFSRRRLLEVGSLGMAGLALPELFQRTASAAGNYGRPAGTKSCIFIVQYGGAPHHDTFDPKPDAPRDIRGLYRPIATSVPGVQICEKLPRLARLANRYCLVRSMTHTSGGHNDGMHVCLSGQSNGADADDSPYFGSVMAKLRPATRNVPPYVWIQNLAGDVGNRYEGGGFLGPVYAPMRIEWTSPRITAFIQTLAWSPSSTSPITCADTST